MKHIKIYEKFSKDKIKESIIHTRYKKGDHVLLCKSYKWLLPYGQVIKREIGKPTDRYIDRYYVEIFLPNKNHWQFNFPEEHYYIWITEYEIIQKLTKKQIEEFELELQALKYNL